MNHEQIWLIVTLGLALLIMLRTIQKVLRMIGSPHAKSAVWIVLLIGVIGIAAIVRHTPDTPVVPTVDPLERVR